MIAAMAFAAALHPASPARRPADARAFDGATGPASIVVGSLTLRRCAPVVPGYCGRITVPLNWLDWTDGAIGIRFELIVPPSGLAPRTIVAQEGGPGYASTGTGAEYDRLFKPLLVDHNLLMMDERGTGASTPIDCEPLQAYSGSSAADAYKRVVAECGAALNHTFRNAFGNDVHASDLFGTSDSVNDLAAVLAAVGQAPVDLYGDSYGSFFAQVFAARYPQLLHSVVLDSTYPTLEQNPFDPPGQERVRYSFDQTCLRSEACAAVVHGAATHLLHRLALRLQSAPLRARTTTPAGRPVTIEAGAPELEAVLTAGGYDTGVYRNLPAAASAWLDRGDDVPLARLFAWTLRGPAFYPRYGYREFSAGMGLADQCTVYANPFDPEAPIVQRRVQYAESLAQLPAQFAFPVSNADAVSAPDEPYDECLTWPKVEHHYGLIARPPPIVPATLPVLILSGDIDTVTSHGDAELAARQIGPSATFVNLPNEIHAPALDDGFDCAQQIVRQFVRAPHAPLDTVCTASIPEVRTLGVFPTALRDMPPASAQSGNGATLDELRLAALAVDALGDSLLGAGYVYALSPQNCPAGYCGTGLRGGRYAASPELGRIVLDRIAYSEDTLVAGEAHVTGALFPAAPGNVTAQLRASGPHGLGVAIDVSWDERSPHASVTITGKTAAGRTLAAIAPAPT